MKEVLEALVGITAVLIALVVGAFILSKAQSIGEQQSQQARYRR